MFTFLLFVFAAGVIGLIRPVWGIFIFLFANTGAEGLLIAAGLTNPVLGPFQVGATAILGTIAALVVRPGREGPSQRSFISFFVWSLSAVMLVSRFVELGQIGTRIVSELIFVCLWGPLLLAFDRMTRTEWAACGRAMVFISGWTAFLALTISVTESQWLYDLLVYKSNDLDETGFMAGRIQVPGMWGFMPFGLWIALQRLHFSSGESLKARAFNMCAVLLVLGAIAVNLTKALLLGVVFGGVLLVIGLLSLRGRHRGRAALVALALVGGLGIGMMAPGIWEAWQDRQVELRINITDVSEPRITRSLYVLEVMLSDLRLFGQKDHWAEEAELSGVLGDPHTVLTMWVNYGTVAMALFVGLIVAMLATFVGLLRSGRTLDIRAETWFLLAWYGSLHSYMIGGNYLLEVTVFSVMYFAAQTIRLSRTARLVGAAPASNRFKRGSQLWRIGRWSLPAQVEASGKPSPWPSPERALIPYWHRAPRPNSSQSPRGSAPWAPRR